MQVCGNFSDKHGSQGFCRAKGKPVLSSVTSKGFAGRPMASSTSIGEAPPSDNLSRTENTPRVTRSNAQKHCDRADKQKNRTIQALTYSGASCMFASAEFINK